MSILRKASGYISPRYLQRLVSSVRWLDKNYVLERFAAHTCSSCPPRVCISAPLCAPTLPECCRRFNVLVAALEVPAHATAHGVRACALLGKRVGKAQRPEHCNACIAMPPHLQTLVQLCSRGAAAGWRSRRNAGVLLLDLSTLQYVRSCNDSALLTVPNGWTASMLLLQCN